jgi:tRNA pseudouridine55 synthase
MPARQVDIHSLTLLATPAPDLASFSVLCGKGTYIRALARDLATHLGTVGHLTELRRTKVGPFLEKSAISLDMLEKLWHCPPEFEGLLPLTTALDDIPAVAISEAQANSVRHGNDVTVPQTADGIVCAMNGNIPVAISKIEDGRLFPIRVFNM